jgi:hypothetical protein
MKRATLKKITHWIILSSLLLVAACANGGYQQPYTPSYAPPYSYPSYYYTPDYYYQNDPQFWQMWQDRQGGGG